MKDSRNSPQSAKDIFNQVQDKAVRVVDLTKWKLDQQSRLIKLGGDIRVLENEIKEKKVFLANTAFTMHTQGIIRWDELQGLCIKIEQLNILRENKVKERSGVETEQPPQARLNENHSPLVSPGIALPPAPVSLKISDELHSLLSQAESALQRGDRKHAAGFINEALKIDYTSLEIWALLQKILGSQQNLNDFQVDFTKKYFPENLLLLTIPTRVDQKPVIAQVEEIDNKQKFIAAPRIKEPLPAQHQSEVIFYQDDSIYISSQKVKYKKGEISTSKIYKVWESFRPNFFAMLAGPIIVGSIFYFFFMGRTVSLLLLAALIAMSITVPMILTRRKTVWVQTDSARIEIYVSKDGKKATVIIQSIERAIQLRDQRF